MIPDITVMHNVEITGNNNHKKLTIKFDTIYDLCQKNVIAFSFNENYEPE